MNKQTNFKTRLFVALNTNARSLAPKMESLANCMEEIEADVAVVTETWLQDREVEATLIDLAGEHSLDSFLRNRQEEANNGRQ